MKKIIFERSGGFMGRKISIDLDLDKLPASQSRKLQRLLDEADFFNLPENLISNSLPDGFSYTITVEEETEIRTIQLSDTTAPEAVRPLLENLSRWARSKKPTK
jgi:hypothetical protein